MSSADQNFRPAPDREISDIAQYVCNYRIGSEEAYETAVLCLMDSLGCAMLALGFPECTKLLGPYLPGTVAPLGARVPGTRFELDPVKAAFDIGILIRWLDFNDTWLAAEWGHPSDNLAGILAVADSIARSGKGERKEPLRMREVLTAMIKAYEIQGVMALENSFNRVGLDHVALVKLATAAVVTRLLGGGVEQVTDVVSQVWVDGQSLRTYRHAPNTGSRKSWAAGDAASRAVQLALLTMRGEKGYPSALTARTWGFYDASFRGERFRLQRPYGCYVIENILFKSAFPAEFHAQTAVECAIKLHQQVTGRLDEIERVVITTQESALRIISKSGPLYNPADRDHCLQYMVAIGLIFGGLTAEHYSDAVAADARIDRLRERMEVVEEKAYSSDYLDPEKRSIANAIEVIFRDGSTTGKVEVQYPLGHRRRRQEALPHLLQKCRSNLLSRFSETEVHRMMELFSNRERLEDVPVEEFMGLLAT
jgi:2-methylcitrate dehydratase